MVCWVLCGIFILGWWNMMMKFRPLELCLSYSHWSFNTFICNQKNLNVLKRKAEIVSISCKKWDLISSKFSLCILFKNALKLAWWWPCEVKTCRYIGNTLNCCICWSFVCIFLHNMTHNRMYNFKIPVLYLIGPRFRF